MKIKKVFLNLFNPPKVLNNQKILPPCPIRYDRNNVTASEFRKYIHWLAENKINKVVIEPDRFVTEAERELSVKKNLETEKFRKFVRYLSENNINMNFWC